jgi:hypothetical protein
MPHGGIFPMSLPNFALLQHRPRTHLYALIPPPKIRIATPLPFEQFFTPDPLAVAAVPKLEPTGWLKRQVQTRFPFGDNAFEIMLAGKPEQPFAVLLNVVAVQKPFAPLRYNQAEPELPLN